MFERSIYCSLSLPISDNLPEHIKSSKASKIIEDVKNYINDNYQNYELNIDEIARNLFINYAHLCFIFKRDTGVTINEYLTEFRIRKAKELVDSGNTLVLDVASKVGYADANYFGKCFKKFYGIPPSIVTEKAICLATIALNHSNLYSKLERNLFLSSSSLTLIMIHILSSLS